MGRASGPAHPGGGSYLGGLGWLLALAYVDGGDGLSRALGNRYEYLDTARATDDVPRVLEGYVARIPYAAPDNHPTHVAGHPPGALLVFVVLHRLGLGGDWSAGLVVTVLAASTSVAVLVALRALGAEHVARRAAPFLVLGPAAVWTAVSADALFTVVAAWGLCALAVAATRGTARAAAGWSALAGLLLGYCVMMSYGLPLLGLPATAVLAVARSWRPLPVAAATALLVVAAVVVLALGQPRGAAVQRRPGAGSRTRPVGRDEPRRRPHGSAPGGGGGRLGGPGRPVRDEQGGGGTDLAAVRALAPAVHGGTS